MPDLKSELAKINAAIKNLKFDDEDEGPETVSTNDADLQPQTTTKRVFDYIAAHPGSSSSDVRAALEDIPTTVFSQLTQRGVLARTMGPDGLYRYTTAVSEYKPMTYEERLARAREARQASAGQPKERPRKTKRRYTKRAKATTHQPAPASAPAAEPRIVNSMDELVDTLTLKQARELYDRLRQIFGG